MNVKLPPNFPVLADSLGPVATHLAYVINLPSAGIAGVGGPNGVRDHLRRFNHAIAALKKSLRKLNRVAGLPVEDHRASVREAGRFSECVDTLVGLYKEGAGVTLEPHTVRAREILCDMHRHALKQIHAWLVELVETMRDPIAALQKRDLPDSGKVTLTLVLELTPPRNLDDLHALLKSADRLDSSSRRRSASSSSSSLWALVLAFALGHALGDDDCGE